MGPGCWAARQGLAGLGTVADDHPCGAGIDEDERLDKGGSGYDTADDVILVVVVKDTRDPDRIGWTGVRERGERDHRRQQPKGERTPKSH